MRRKLYYGTSEKIKELDHYLKWSLILYQKKLDSFINGNDKKMTYYTGNWRHRC